jgi:hypothetical protein
LDRYLVPLSQTKVTTRLGAVCSRQKRRAAASRVPEEEPPSTPSRISSRRAASTLSRSVME